ncbi:MAG: GNAT family N-acetyltransferase [Prevotella ruminicola]|uniref:GNAT family N-acetyltransferase n=1 Tax=Xylanibacter ruminicola TaxID=839 RepID=A0A9D5S9Y1_XYLRU|nr:GNAT family N-acetyltransferase [Xylanibacter ruminicola]
MIEIREATKSQAEEIARLIMTAMTADCCLYFCGEGHGQEDMTAGRAGSRSAEQASLHRSRLLAAFLKMMTMLVEREDSQYSYRNALVAMDEDRVVGTSVSYDGGCLHELRRAFIEAAKEYLGKDHSGMDDETQAGELYLDSLAVLPEYRRRGIARQLLMATKQRANRLGLPCVGLLVDKDNPVGEALYASVGFHYVNDSQWGGHPMKHLVLV